MRGPARSSAQKLQRPTLPRAWLFSVLLFGAPSCSRGQAVVDAPAKDEARAPSDTARSQPALGLKQRGQCAATTRGVFDTDMGNWRSGGTKSKIRAFVEDISSPGSSNFVPVEERIAVFDNDGTLWSERPLYFQMEYAIARAREQRDLHPEWLKDPLMRAFLERDQEALRTMGAPSHPESSRLLEVSFFGLGPAGLAEYRASVHRFLVQARHPERNTPYVDLAYLPMLELLAYLRCKDFQIFIVSGGGDEFVRAISHELYGVPASHVVGSRQLLQIVERGGRIEVERAPSLSLFNDAEQKVKSLIHAIGARPIIAVGNSDGDIPMLRYVSEQERPTLALLLVHDDSAREEAYESGARSAQARAKESGWLSVSMERDFLRVFVDANDETRN